MFMFYYFIIVFYFAYLYIPTSIKPISGCSTVGRAVASYTRDPQFKSSHRKFYLKSTELNKLYKKTKIKRSTKYHNFKNYIFNVYDHVLSHTHYLTPQKERALQPSS